MPIKLPSRTPIPAGTGMKFRQVANLVGQQRWDVAGCGKARENYRDVEPQVARIAPTIRQVGTEQRGDAASGR